MMKTSREDFENKRSSGKSDMENIITFPIKKGAAEYGAACNLCFGCGENTSEQITVVFEDTDKFTLVGKIDRLLSRKSLRIPVCQHCRNVVSTCRKKILLWVVILFAVIFGVLGLAIARDVNLEKDQWPLFVMIGAAIWPMSKIKKYWIIKDRGGAFVDLVEVTWSSVTLAFADPHAHSKLQAVQPGER